MEQQPTLHIDCAETPKSDIPRLLSTVNNKANLSPYLINYHAMKTYGGVEGKLHRS
jgi:hypothetical protein